MTAAAPRAPRTRPFGVVAIAILQVGEAAWVASGILGIRYLDPASLAGQVSTSLPRVEVVFGVLAGVMVVSSLGLWFLQRWAWIATMLLTGVQLAFMLLSIWQGGSDWIRLLLLTVTALYLNQRAVIAAFGDPRAPRVPPIPADGSAR